MEGTLICCYEIYNTLLGLKKYINQINDKSDITKVKARIYGDIKKITTAISEVLVITDNGVWKQNIANDKELLKSLITDMDEMDTPIQIKELLTNMIVNSDILSYDFLNWDTGDLANFYDNHSCDPTTAADINPIILENIFSKIKSDGELKLFDVRCKEGYNAAQIKKGLPNVYIYGSEKNVSLADKAKNIVNRCIKGGLAGSKISNEVFDIVFVVPEIKYDIELTYQGTVKEREEKSTLRNTIKYLRPNGLYMYTIPYYRLTRDITFMLSRLLSDVSLIKHSDTTGVKYVTVIGYKNPKKEADQEIYSYLNSFDEYIDIPSFTSLKEYNVEAMDLEIEYFRGSILDNDELESICNNSSLYDSFWEKQEMKSTVEDNRPLLPFNMGQIGLVLTSGCLDGIVEEYEGQYHAIKGRVVKIKQVITETNETRTEQVKTEKYTNIVQINIFSPDGEFIELT